MKTLLSYTKSHSDTKMTGTETLSVPMETEKLVKQKKGSEPQKEVEGHRGAVKGKRGVGEGDGGETTEGDSEIEMEAALDLVDQMEIEISDGEKETCGLSPKVGNVVVSSEGVEKNGRGMVGGKLEARSTKSSDEVVRAGRGERSRSRRRHSSGIPTVDFPAISQGRQLSDEETVELMDLLHVCCGLKARYTHTHTHTHTNTNTNTNTHTCIHTVTVSDVPNYARDIGDSQSHCLYLPLILSSWYSIYSYDPRHTPCLSLSYWVGTQYTPFTHIHLASLFSLPLLKLQE